MIKALTNDWLFRRSAWNDMRFVDRYANSVSTIDSDENERAAIDWLRNHPRRPLGEWSDLADPFEPAGWEDWSPVRSVRLATAGQGLTPAPVVGLPSRRRRRRLTAEDVAQIRAELRARMGEEVC